MFHVVNDFLNQADAGCDCQPARTWFLEVAFVQCVCVCVCVLCVCVSAPEAMNN